jgi:hypothetical protein
VAYSTLLVNVERFDGLGKESENSRLENGSETREFFFETSRLTK